MAYSRSTILILARMSSRLASLTGRTVDVQYMSMSARYADHVVGLALQSADAELKAMGAILRHDFFGPGGMFPGGKLTWCAPATSEPREALPAWRQSIDSAASIHQQRVHAPRPASAAVAHS